MNTTPTPETDAVNDRLMCQDSSSHNDFMVMLDHARKLERERDQLEIDVSETQALYEATHAINVQLRADITTEAFTAIVAYKAYKKGQSVI